MRRMIWVAAVCLACADAPTETGRMSPTFEVRPDLVEVGADATETALRERRLALVERVLASLAPEHRQGWAAALTEDSDLRIYAVDDSEERAELIAEIYAIDAQLTRRSARRTK